MAVFFAPKTDRRRNFISPFQTHFISVWAVYWTINTLSAKLPPPNLFHHPHPHPLRLQSVETHTIARAWPRSLSHIYQSIKTAGGDVRLLLQEETNFSIARMPRWQALAKNTEWQLVILETQRTHTHTEQHRSVRRSRWLQHVSWLTYFENTFTGLATHKHAHLGSRTPTRWVNVPAGGVTLCVSQKKSLITVLIRQKQTFEIHVNTLVWLKMVQNRSSEVRPDNVEGSKITPECIRIKLTQTGWDVCTCFTRRTTRQFNTDRIARDGKPATQTK